MVKKHGSRYFARAQVAHLNFALQRYFDNDMAKDATISEKTAPTYSPEGSNGEFAHSSDVVEGLHRRLSNRQIQWIAIGGSIGTALFVSIAWGLVEGGPGSLFIAFAIYCAILALANNCMAEMTVFMPVVGGWVRMGSKWVDEAYGFMAGWNFFV